MDGAYYNHASPSGLWYKEITYESKKPRSGVIIVDEMHTKNWNPEGVK